MANRRLALWHSVVAIAEPIPIATFSFSCAAAVPSFRRLLNPSSHVAKVKPPDGWMQIDFEKRTLTVGESKTAAGEGRVIQLNARALAVLAHWTANFPNRDAQHFVFAREKYGQGGAYATDPTQALGSWKEAWEEAKKRAGVKCRWHDLRHTACSRMIDGGTPLRAVAVIMGWAASTEVLMARRYAHPSQAVLADAVKSLNGPEFAPEVESLQNSLQSTVGSTDTIQ